MVRNILCDDTSGSNYNMISDCNARHNDSSPTSSNSLKILSLSVILYLSKLRFVLIDEIHFSFSGYSITQKS